MPGYPDFDGICLHCGKDEYVCHCDQRHVVSTEHYLAYQEFRAAHMTRQAAHRAAGVSDGGYESVIHHIDGDSSNNDPANLVIVDAKGNRS